VEGGEKGQLIFHKAGQVIKQLAGPE